MAPYDWLLCSYMIWETIDQFEQVKNIVFNTWINTLLNLEIDMSFDSINAQLNDVSFKVQTIEGPVAYKIEGVNHYAYLNDKIDEVVFIDASDYDKKSDILRYKHCKLNEWDKKNKKVETFYTTSVYCHFSSDGKEISFNGDTYKVVEQTQVIVQDKKWCNDTLKQIQANINDVAQCKNTIINKVKQDQSILTIANEYELDYQFDDLLQDVTNRTNGLIERIKNAQ